MLKTKVTIDCEHAVDDVDDLINILTGIQSGNIEGEVKIATCPPAVTKEETAELLKGL